MTPERDKTLAGASLLGLLYALAIGTAVQFKFYGVAAIVFVQGLALGVGAIVAELRRR